MFGRSDSKEVVNQRMLCFPPHSSSASALPCENGKPRRQRTAALCVQQGPTPAALSTSFLLNHAPNHLFIHPNALITWFRVLRESYSIVSVSCELKRLTKSNSWLNSGNARIHWVKMRFSCCCVLSGSPEAHVIRGGIVICLSIVCFISNIPAKEDQNPFYMSQSYSNSKVGRFLRHGVEALGQCIPPPRHVLPVSRYQSRHLANLSVSSSLIITTASIWRINMNEWLDALSVSPNSDESEKQSLYPDGDPDRHQNLIACSLANCQPSLKISCKSVRKFLRKVANK